MLATQKTNCSIPVLNVTWRAMSRFSYHLGGRRPGDMGELSLDLVILVVFFKMAESLYVFMVVRLVLKKVVSSAILEVETEVHRA